MAKNDMEMIMYKILRYLYECNKAGKVPTFSDMFDTLELPGIPQSYLTQIVLELISPEYIAGCSVTETKDGTIFQLSRDARITAKGVSYLNENKRMKKAENAAGRAFELLLEALVSAAFSL